MAEDESVEDALSKALSEIVAPYPQHPVAAQPVASNATLSLAEYDRWVPAPTALADVANAYEGYEHAYEALNRRLSDGTLRFCVKSARWEEGDNQHRTTILEIMSSVVWAHFMPPAAHNFWVIGDADIFFKAPTYQYTGFNLFPSVALRGVRFDPAGLNDLLAPYAARLAEPISLADPAMPPAKGGRPRLEYWEPLLIEMARQLYEGELKPKRLVDIEKAMQDWLSTKGFNWSETPLRTRAHKLFESLNK